MSPPEKRLAPRRAVALPVVLQVELHGYDADRRRFRCEGRTVNMSQGGFLAQVDRAVDEGTRCLANFPSAVGQIGRTMIYGRVQRARVVGSGFEVAVEFDNPVLGIDLLPEAEAR